jgi:hypothetical protein
MPVLCLPQLKPNTLPFGKSLRQFGLGLSLALTLIAGYAAPSYAQDDELDALPPSTDDVQIEVLVFRFPGKGAGAEMKAGQAAVNAAGQRIGTTPSESNYSEIAPGQRKLDGAYSRLQASSDTKPLLFSAWKQALSDQRWIALESTGGGEKISGRLLLSNGKPLSLKLELQLDGAQLIASPANGGAASARFRMRATRPAHFEETLYFDHPAFGALVRVDLAKAP